MTLHLHMHLVYKNRKNQLFDLDSTPKLSVNFISNQSIRENTKQEVLTKHWRWVPFTNH